MLRVSPLATPRLRLARAFVLAMRVAQRAGVSLSGHPLLSMLPSPRDRHTINAWLYDARASYLPGSPYFAAGLAPWEEAALAALPFPPFESGGRWLVAAAGGGREVAPLVARGLDVWCLEPAARLFAGLATIARPGRALHASFADLDDPRSPLVAAAPFSAIVIGSAALSHLTTPKEQHALFAALRRLGPQAPVLSSQLSSHGDPAGRAGARFSLDHGFHYLFTDEELGNLAQAHGYRLHREPGWPPESTLWIPV